MIPLDALCKQGRTFRRVGGSLLSTQGEGGLVSLHNAPINAVLSYVSAAREECPLPTSGVQIAPGGENQKRGLAKMMEVSLT